MTDLQISLIAIGGAIVAGVVVYNKWHEARARKNVERAFATEQDDVLMKPAGTTVASANITERHEPVFSEQDFPVMTEEIASEHVVRTRDLPQANAPADLPVDIMIDCVIPLLIDAPVRGEKIMPSLMALRHVGNKPINFMGLALPSSPSAEPVWQALAHGGVYTELQAGVQLACRGSALNELEYSEMVVRLREVADDVGAEPDIPDMSLVMVLARSVYQFVSDHDARLGLNIRSNGAPWEITTLLAALERQGFDVRPDGRYVMSDGEGGVLFSMTTNEPITAEQTSRITLLLDVPRVAQDKDGFGAMLACAKALAVRLDGTIVDDSSQILTDAAIDEIAAQVDAFYDEMRAAEVPAGSHRALRLFI